MITIYYNGSINLPEERNHKTTRGFQQLKKSFSSIDNAIMFWLECEFYSGAITTLEEILPPNSSHPLLECLEEKPIPLEEVLLPDQKLLYNLKDEDYEY